MRIKNINLDIDWEIILLYDATCDDVVDIKEVLHSIKCPDKYIKEAVDYLEECDFNKGFTYSNEQEKVTVILMGITRNIPQLINTISHEVYHFIRHLSYVKLLNNEEEEATLMGDVTMKIYSKI